MCMPIKIPLPQTWQDKVMARHLPPPECVHHLFNSKYVVLDFHINLCFETLECWRAERQWKEYVTYFVHDNYWHKVLRVQKILTKWVRWVSVRNLLRVTGSNYFLLTVGDLMNRWCRHWMDHSVRTLHSPDRGPSVSTYKCATPLRTLHLSVGL